MNDDFKNGYQNEPNGDNTEQDTAEQAPNGNGANTQNEQYYNPGGQYYDPNQGQYYNPNGQYYNPNGQYYNPNGNPGQFHPNSFFYPPQQPDACGKTAQTFGIIALIGLFFCQILSIIFGALALSNAKKSVTTLGYECSEARGGRIMGLIGLIIGCVQVGFFVLALILAIVTSSLAAGVI